MARSWLITGCSSGFGLELAKAASARGGRVVATARRTADLDAFVASAEGRVSALQLDVADLNSIPGTVKRAAEMLGGRIDVLVNNAGMGVLASVEDTTRELSEACVKVNFTGPLEVLRAVLGVMRTAGPDEQGRRGWVVQMSAAAAIANYAGFGVYGASKAAMEMVCESAAAELAGLGVRFTIVQPGPFRTQFIGKSVTFGAAMTPEYQATVGKFGALLRGMNGKQPGDPAKAAELIVSIAEGDFGAEPPARLVLGKYAMGKVKKMLAARGAELDAWAERAAATEFSPKM
ncbi:MAG: SDR family NAD(P)-dependent oxidoreductase [Phycisphaerales bacterium]|nr:SDR family NAD(P)-dependent oxidoreductase [Phycisphaerales bacterium]